MNAHLVLKIVIIFISFIPSFLLSAKTNLTQDSLTTYWLNEIIIEGKKSDLLNTLPLHKVPVDEIQKIDAVNASQVLSLVPGIYFSLSSKNETTFCLRGFEQRQISVFLDGVPISVPYNGIIDLAQFAGDNISEIRVSSGLSSVLYGSNTLGGSVNIMTGESTQGKRLNFRAEASDYGRFFTSLDFHGEKGKFQYYSYLNYSKAPNFRLPESTEIMPNEDGQYRDHSNYQKMSGAFKIKYDANARHQFGLQVNIIKNRFDIPPNALSSFPRFWRFTDWQRDVISLNSEHRLNDRMLIRSILYFDRYANTLKSYDDATYSSQTRKYAFTSIYDDYSFGSNLYPQLRLFTIGLTSGLVAFKQDVHRQKSPSSIFQIYATRLISVGLQQNWNVNAHWFVQLGADWNYLQPIEANHTDLRDPISLFNAQLLIKFSPFSHWAFHFSLGKKSRFPTLKELYSEYLGRSIANPGLKPEHALNNELGLEWQTGRQSLHFTIFYNTLKDLITSQFIAKPLYQMQNVGQARMYGFELGVRKKIGALHLLTNYLYLTAKNVSAVKTSSHLEYRPKHTLYSTLDYTLKKWTLGAEFQWVADQYYQNPDHLLWEKLNNYSVVNLKIRYAFSAHFQFYFRTNNALDTFYYSEFGVPMPGRELTLGVKAQF